MLKEWIVVLLLIVLAVMLRIGAGQATAVPTMTDYSFQPARITARAGQTVTIMLVNASAQKKLHEFMVGRTVVKDHSGRPAGYERDFFEGVAIKVSNASGVWRMEEGKAKVTGAPKPKMETGGMTMGHEGFMIELEAGGTATLTFTVPATRVGEWEIGCFSEAGDHYVKGMRGKFVVAR